MEQAIKLVQLVGYVRDLAKVDLKAFRSRHPVASPLRSLHQSALAFASTALAYDGFYLAICGRYELSVRELVERFVELVVADVPVHAHLPAAIKDWHPKGSADIILRIQEEQFRHLTVVGLVGNLASCLSPSSKSSYKLTPESYSYNDRNFWAGEIERLLSERLGLSKIWQKLSRHPGLVAWSGAAHPSTVENLCRQELDSCMARRNAIVHRGRSYFTPGASEVVECAEFLTVLIEGIAETLTAYKAAL
jgi:hypothetical protein